MLIFIWWWFPRTWNKGVKQENAQLDDVEIQAERAMVVQNARSIVDNYRETLKQRELAKNAKVESTEVAVEGQSVVTDSTVRGEESTLGPATDTRVNPTSPRSDVRPSSPAS